MRVQNIKNWVKSNWFPIFLCIITITANFLYTNWKIGTSLQQRLIDRIDSAEKIIGSCNLEKKDKILGELAQARYHWIYGNYTASEKMLDELHDDIEYCVSGIAGFEMGSLGIIGIVVIIALVLIFVLYKKGIIVF